MNKGTLKNWNFKFAPSLRKSSKGSNSFSAIMILSTFALPMTYAFGDAHHEEHSKSSTIVETTKEHEGREKESNLNLKKDTVCASLESYQGDVQILDEKRNKLIDTRVGTQILCGGWVSIESGWAQITHKQGFKARFSGGSFVQIWPEKSQNGEPRDQVVLFKGQAYVIAGSGSKEVRLLTANARMSIQRGRAILVFSQAEEETQLITLNHLAALQNRYVKSGEQSSQVIVRAGEASSVNFKLVRVIPSSPKAVSEPSLRIKLEELNFDDKEKAYAIRAVRYRNERKFATELDEQIKRRKQITRAGKIDSDESILQAGSVSRLDTTLHVAESEAEELDTGEGEVPHFGPKPLPFKDPKFAASEKQIEAAGQKGTTLGEVAEETKEQKEARLSNYRRYKPRPGDDERKSHWYRKIAGGVGKADPLLFPDKVLDEDWDEAEKREKRSSRVIASEMKRKKLERENLAEKKRVVSELLKLKPGDPFESKEQ